MATASRKISRKELRQPDWFQVTTEQAYVAFRQHRTKFIAALSAVVALLLIIAGWQIFKTRQNDVASKEFGSALALYQSEKYQEAIPQFQRVQGYRWSRYAPLAYLYEANAYIGLSMFDKALPSAERFLASTGPDTLYRQIALMTLASLEERKNLWKQAIAHYADAERVNAAFQQEARLGKARSAEQLGDLQGAIESYREYLKESQESWVSVRLADLEAKASNQAATKQ